MSEIVDPYQTPTTTNENTVVLGGGESPHGGYVSIGKLGRALRVMLFANAGISLIYGVFSGVHASRLSSTLDSEYLDSTWDEIAVIGIAVLWAILFIASVIMFCKWICRAMRNAWFFSPTVPSISPRWAAGWFFVPIALLWKPFEAMKEIRIATFGNEGTLPNLGWWWGVWIVSNLLDNVSMKMPVDTREQMVNSAWFDALSTPVQIASAILAAGVVQKITEKQESVSTLKNEKGAMTES